jgi:hypothetical protein
VDDCVHAQKVAALELVPIVLSMVKQLDIVADLDGGTVVESGETNDLVWELDRFIEEVSRVALAGLASLAGCR